MINYLFVAICCPFLLQIVGTPGKIEDASDEAESRGSDYFSKKDAKVVALALGMFLFFAIPGFYFLRMQTNLYFCKQRFMAISTALTSYETQNDNRLPPVYLPAENGMPAVDDKGRPLTWATTLVNLAGIDGYDGSKSFMCTNATKSQAAITEGPDGGNLYMTFGMFTGVAMQPTSNFTDPGNAIVIAETSNGGTFGTFDPYPIRPNGPGTSPEDAYEIGFDSPSDLPVDGKFPGASVTRLAFGDSTQGLNEQVSDGRHGSGSMALFLDGHFGLINNFSAFNKSHWPIPTPQNP